MSETTALIVCILMVVNFWFGFLVGYYHFKDSNGGKRER